MSISRSDYLIELIQVLDKSEKRTFKLQSSRQANHSDKLYIQLFDLLDKFPEKDESYYKDKLGLKSLQYANLKRNLYTQILKSLRVISSNKDYKFQLKEMSDHAHLLFEKGLHKQSSALIDRIKPIAIGKHASLILIEVVELQKKIESKFITRSRGVKNKMESLIQKSEEIIDGMNLRGTLSNLCLRIQGLYIKAGYARDDRDSELYKAYFYSNLPNTDRLTLRPTERILWHQSHVWYHHANVNFHFAYKHSVSWIECYHQNISLIEYDQSNYLRALHYVLIYSFYLSRVDKYNYWYSVLNSYRKNNKLKFSRVHAMIDFTYYYNARINYIVINNKYSQLSKVASEIKAGELYYGNQLDQHRYYIFYYKIASMYSYIGNYDKAIDYCNAIIAGTTTYLKKDIGPYTRLLHIMCNFRMNNFLLVDNMIDSIRSEFYAQNQNNEAIDLILNFLKKASRAMNFGLDDDITKLHNRLTILNQQQYNKLAFIYYDYINWCLSLLHNTSVEKVKKQFK